MNEIINTLAKEMKMKESDLTFLLTSTVSEIKRLGMTEHLLNCKDESLKLGMILMSAESAMNKFTKFCGDLVVDDVKKKEFVKLLSKIL